MKEKNSALAQSLVLTMETIEDAKQSLFMSSGFSRTKNGATFLWNGISFDFETNVEDNDKSGILVGISHSLVCHNTLAILNRKETFDFDLGNKIITLPVKHGNYVKYERYIS